MKNYLSLEELIESLGDELLSIDHIPDGSYDDGRKIWIASSKNHSRAGESVREAVEELKKNL